MVGLKPCPLCGSMPKISCKPNRACPSETDWTIACACGAAMILTHTTDDEAVKRWNTRAIDVLTENERLRGIELMYLAIKPKLEDCEKLLEKTNE